MLLGFFFSLICEFDDTFSYKLSKCMLSSTGTLNVKTKITYAFLRV